MINTNVDIAVCITRIMIGNRVTIFKLIIIIISSATIYKGEHEGDVCVSRFRFTCAISNVCVR